MSSILKDEIMLKVKILIFILNQYQPWFQENLQKHTSSVKVQRKIKCIKFIIGQGWKCDELKLMLVRVFNISLTQQNEHKARYYFKIEKTII